MLSALNIEMMISAAQIYYLISGQKWSTTHRVLKFDGCKIYVIIKPVYPPGYHHNGFVATHGLGHSIFHKCVSCHKVIVVITRRAHCFHDYIYITCIWEHKQCVQNV